MRPRGPGCQTLGVYSTYIPAACWMLRAARSPYFCGSLHGVEPRAAGFGANTSSGCCGYRALVQDRLFTVLSRLVLWWPMSNRVVMTVASIRRACCCGSTDGYSEKGPCWDPVMTSALSGCLMGMRWR